MKIIPKQRILPNGTKDEIRGSEGKFIKKIGETIPFAKMSWQEYAAGHTENYYASQVYFINIGLDLGGEMLMSVPHLFTGVPYTMCRSSSIFNTSDSLCYLGNATAAIRIKVPKSAYTDVWTLAETQAWFEQNQVTLIYQLAKPKIYQSKFIY